MKKLVLLIFLVSCHIYPAQQLEKPKLSCMAKIGLPTLGDRFEMIRTARNNLLQNPQANGQSDIIWTQFLKIRQLNQKDIDILKDLKDPTWDYKLELISSSKRSYWLGGCAASALIAYGVLGFLTSPTPQQRCSFLYGVKFCK